MIPKFKTLFIQVTVGFAPIILTLLSSYLGGAEVQSKYSVFKAELDFWVQWLVLGMHQSIIYFGSKKVTQPLLVHSLKYYLGFVFLIWVVLFLFNGWHDSLSNQLLSIAVIGTASYTIGRTLRYVFKGENAFNLDTIKYYAIALFLGIGLGIYNANYIILGWVIASIVAIVTFTYAFWNLPFDKEVNIEKQEIFSVYKYGLSDYVMAVMLQIPTIIGLKWLESTSGSIEVANYGILILLIAILTKPINALNAPILRYFVSLEQFNIHKNFKAKYLFLIVPGSILFVIGILLIKTVIIYFLGLDYELVANIAYILVFIVPLFIVTKLSMLWLQSRGESSIAMIPYIVKAIVFLLTIYLSPIQHVFFTIVIALIAAEVVCFFAYMIGLTYVNSLSIAD